MKTTNIMDVFNLFNLIAKGGKEQGWLAKVVESSIKPSH
jgi:hypothetical protein